MTHTDILLHSPSQAQGQVGEKIEIQAHVILQHSTPVATNGGLVYSHYHVLIDANGNLYKYKGSSFYPLHNKVHITATVKGYTSGLRLRSQVTVIKAPKPASSVKS